MKAIMMMFDSLNRNLLEPYGCDWTKTPNFKRLAEHSVRFDTCYVGSMPCMPARRELHTGRYNFLHRSWGPIEPFDDSLPEQLKQHGIYTHLITDHYHYWEDGGATYHNRYSSWEFVRGQEGDPWKACIEEPQKPKEIIAREFAGSRHYWANRPYLEPEENRPIAKTIQLAEEFLQKNHQSDNWFLQVECFDPHEPFFSAEHYMQMYPHNYQGPYFDWPPYRQINETDRPDAREHIRCMYAALLSMCDAYLGRILDKMDAYGLWEDTMLIVNTDHGYMLGEHDWWGKNVRPTYKELANIPLFVWDPRFGIRNESRKALVQTIDLVPTLYDYFQVEIPKTVDGKKLTPALLHDTPIRDRAIYGLHGASINITDGRYVYMCAPDPENDEVYNYTVMCTHMQHPFTIEEMRSAVLAGPFAHTKGCKVLKIKKGTPRSQAKQLNQGSFLYDLASDPGMEHPIQDAEAEKYMQDLLISVLKENDTPDEVYVRYRLNETEKEEHA